MLLLSMQHEGIEETPDRHVWVIDPLRQHGPTLHEFSAGRAGST